MVGAGLIALVLASVITFQVGYLVGLGRRPRATVLRLSPDERTRASLVEVGDGTGGEREVSFRLERTSDRGEAFRLDLPGVAGGVAGTERLIWSRDGTRVVLVGRHFFGHADLMLAGGDELFLLHDVTSGRTWINSAADLRLPPLTADQISGVEFTEPVVLKSRTRVDPDSWQKPE